MTIYSFCRTKLVVVFLHLVIFIVSGQEDTTESPNNNDNDETPQPNNNGNETTTLVPGGDDTSIVSSSTPPPTSSTCNCDECPDEFTVALGLHNDLVSPECPEGSVATVTKLRTIDTSGTYDLVTWNPGDYSADINLRPNYIYRQATMRETSCYEINPQNLPVVGDQSQIEVKMNCESIYCNFQYDVQFDCAKLGVLTTDTDGGGLQILSDVDDTITCSNPSTTCDSIASCTLEGTVSHYLAGIDQRLEHKEMYPGVAEIMAALALGPNPQHEQYYPAKPMLLSARPREAQLLLAIDQDSEINQYYETVGQRINKTSWGINIDSSMYGTITDGTSFTEFGQTKAQSFNTISAERPNTRFGFLGDNGQGDVCAAQSMLESDNGSRMVVVLIHQVLPLEETHSECKSPEDGQEFTLNLPESDKVHYHRTHSDAAIWLLDKGLISCCSASNVWYAVAEWITCRCRSNDDENNNNNNNKGFCPIGGLNTGVSDAASRSETLAYCEEVKADQELLLAKLESCDPNKACPPPEDVIQPRETSSSSSYQRRGGNGFLLWVGSSLIWLQLNVILAGGSK